MTEVHEEGSREGAAAWLVVVGITTLQSGVALIGLSAMLGVASGTGAIAAWVAFLPAVVALQALHSSPTGRRLRRNWGMWTLGLQTALTYLPSFAFGVEWPGMGGFAAGAGLAVMPGWRGKAVFTAATAGAWAVGRHSGLPYIETACVTGVTMAVGFGVAAMIRFAWWLSRTSGAQAAAERRAAQDERVRIARDLHDLLASRLTIATLRAEMADRYVGVQNDRARSELRNMMGLTRDVLTDVRSLAHRYSQQNLRDELESSRCVLDNIGISVSVRWEADAPYGEADDLLAIAVREGVVNLLRHSEATHCSIIVRSCVSGVELCMRNDGADGPARLIHPSVGRGLGNLAARASAAGGECTASVSDHGWFRLTVTCPARDGRTSAATPLLGRSGPHPDGSVPRAC